MLNLFQHLPLNNFYLNFLVLLTAKVPKLCER